MGGVAAGKKGGRGVDAVFTCELPNHTAEDGQHKVNSANFFRLVSYYCV